jgi:predicted dehydrogenase
MWLHMAHNSDAPSRTGEKLRVGIVGCGWFGNFHLDLLLARGDVEIAALATANEQRLENAGRKAPGARRCRSAAEMLQAERLDAVILCVPPNSHGSIERDCASKGVHLYVEKPLGLGLREARENEAAIRESGIVCAVGYQMRYAPGIAEIRGEILSRGVGAVYGRWIDAAPDSGWWRDKARSGGQVVEQSTHVADLMRYFAGEAESVFAMAREKFVPRSGHFTADDCSVAAIRFRKGAVASLSTGCFCDSGAGLFDAGLRLDGRDYRLDVDWKSGLRFFCGGDERAFPFGGNIHAHAMSAFIEAVKTRDASLIRSDYSDALRSFELTLAIERSIASGQPVRL